MTGQKRITLERREYLGGLDRDGAIERTTKMIDGLWYDAFEMGAEPIWATFRLESESVEEISFFHGSIITPTYTTASVDVLKS